MSTSRRCISFGFLAAGLFLLPGTYGLLQEALTTQADETDLLILIVYPSLPLRIAAPMVSLVAATMLCKSLQNIPITLYKKGLVAVGLVLLLTLGVRAFGFDRLVESNRALLAWILGVAGVAIATTLAVMFLRHRD